MTNNLINLKWVSSNFGSSFSALPSFYDVNHDGKVDMIASSVDGEIICYDLTTGEPLMESYWPVYISNDHFFSKPIMYIYGENYNHELILITSQKGLLYLFDWKGFLVNSLKIDNIYLHKNWSFINFKSVNELISFKADFHFKDLYHELYPEIYADGIILDLNVTGLATDLVIPVNFVSKDLGAKDVVISTIVVFSLLSQSIQSLTPLKISLKNSEIPGYLLTNFNVLEVDSYQIIVTSTSGIINKLLWDKVEKKFISLFPDSLIYNIGPNKCHLTEFCRNSNNTFEKNSLCCIYIDYYGHMVVMDLIRLKSLWEYEFRDGGVPTELEIFIDSSSVFPNVYAIFATDRGRIHCVSLLTGESRLSFPLLIEQVSFNSNPKIVLDTADQVFILLLSNEGKLYKIPMKNPEDWIILIQNEQISSYLSPVLLQSSKKANSDLIIQSKSGFLFKYELLNLKPQKEKFSKASLNSVSPGHISSLYGFGSRFSFDVQIYDPSPVGMDISGNYIIKIFVNEYLYKVQKEWSSGAKLTESQVVIDLQAVNRDLIPESVFLFGTVFVKITNPMGLSFPIDYFYVRLNYDFQFELVWVVYLTFIICTLTLLMLHFYNDNHKFYIPLYENCAAISDKK